MKATIGGGHSGGFGLGALVLVGLIGLAGLAALSAEDIRRYMRIRNM